MIRFIDLKGQIDDDPNFAFLSTVTNRFVLLDGEQMWCTREEFLDGSKTSGAESWFVERCLRLIPEGYFGE